MLQARLARIIQQVACSLYLHADGWQKHAICFSVADISVCCIVVCVSIIPFKS